MRLIHILRRLMQLPVFTTVAVLTLAIGIGANAAIFSVIEGVLLKPLPYPHADELVVLDHSAAGVNLKSTGAALSASMARTSFTLVMLAIAGAMALLLGVAGIYGVISYSVSQRTREIGIRMALGAQRAEVTRMFVRYGFTLAAIGIVCGLAAAVALARVMASLLFEVSPMDPVVYAAVSLSLAAAARLASYVPALRATGVNPVMALRAE